MKDGCVHLYTGDGKGKTTAAAGLAARAAGQGMQVGFFQFLKNGISGEIIALSKLGAQAFAPQTGKFVWEMSEEERAACTARQKEMLARAQGLMPDFDMVVLDEVVCAISENMITKEEIEAFIKARPNGTELVLTGRGAPEWLFEYCDYITEMKPHAHPYEHGLAARKGVEF